MLASGDYESGALFVDFLDGLRAAGVTPPIGATLSVVPDWTRPDADPQYREVEIAGRALQVSSGIADDTLDRAAKAFAQALRQALHAKRQVSTCNQIVEHYSSSWRSHRSRSEPQTDAAGYSDPAGTYRCCLVVGTRG